ncbi:MAG TPA: hypothetical protein VIN09_13545 [Chloroflexota bacterium]
MVRRQAGRIPSGASFQRAPALLRAGAVVVAFGGLGDVAFHVLPGPLVAAAEPLLGPGGARAHLATLLGMVAVLGGLLQTARAGRPRARPGAPPATPTDAPIHHPRR